MPFRDVLADVDPAHADAPVPVLRPSARGPLRSVHHPLEISLACAYGDAADELKLTLPLSFVRVPGAAQGYAAGRALPAYSALYHRDGAPKEDPTPLPRYTPKGQLPDADEEAEAAAADAQELSVRMPAETFCKQRPPAQDCSQPVTES